MDAEFDFKAKGYESPGDWSRLWDLVPANATKEQLGSYRAQGETKAALLALLKVNGIKPGPYDAEAAATRNVA